MAPVTMATQLVCTMPTRVGLLADVAEALSKSGVNIVAISGYERDGEAKFLLVTSDNADARIALDRFNADVREKSVVIAEMPNTPGALEEIAKKIAEADINVEYCYGTVGAHETASVVFKTTDDAKTLALLG
jgi:hypothetical protein